MVKFVGVWWANYGTWKGRVGYDAALGKSRHGRKGLGIMVGLG